MTQPLLLIVDGESLNRPGLVSAMEADGWMVQWFRASEAEAFLGKGLMPDLLVMGSGAQGGPDLVKRLRAGKPALPVLVLAGEPGQKSLGSEGVQGFLEQTQPEREITATLRRFRPLSRPAGDSGKLSTEDIFGDLVDELEREEVQAEAQPDTGTDPFALFAEPRTPTAPVPPPAPLQSPAPPQAPMSSEDIFGGVLEELDAAQIELAPAAPAFQPPAAPPPPARPIPAKPLPPPPAVAPVVPEAPIPAEFTLSGITGVHDPFDWSQQQPAPREATAPTAPTERPSPLAPTPSAPPSASLEEYGNYYLLEKIAVGGMAELFRAQQRGVQGFQKIVAIKRILPHLSDNDDFVTMFIDEAKLAAQLTHPNIVQIFDLGKAGSSYYIAMEYVNGRDLRTLLRKAREIGMPFPEGVAAFVTMKVASALDYAHRKRGFDDRELKLVHRDISPQNILLSQEGAVKLVDFGIAKAASKASNTVAGALKGKLLYMSPEQAMGQSLDNRSDLYSLGLVLFEMLTGERCFQADSELGVLEKVRLGRVQDIHGLNPSVSKDMVAVVNKGLQKHVDHRYPSARFLERDLREVLMKQGHVPTEHDVAEYLQALLLGTKDDVQRVIESRFPQPIARIPVSAGPPPALSETRADLPTPDQAGPTLDPTRPFRVKSLGGAPQWDMEGEEGGQERRPRWLMPVILVISAILCGLFLLASRS